MDSFDPRARGNETGRCNGRVNTREGAQREKKAPLLAQRGFDHFTNRDYGFFVQIVYVPLPVYEYTRQRYEPAVPL